MDEQAQPVLRAAQARASALAEGDAAALGALLHERSLAGHAGPRLVGA